jgi:hypothetical protein
VALYIYRERRFCPFRSRNSYKIASKYNSEPVLEGRGGLTSYGGWSNRLYDVQIFRKPYLIHPDSELDVLYMDLNVLDETYPMVKYKLPFEDFD